MWDLARELLLGAVRTSVERRLPAPARASVVAIGGATFGGSGKTPLAIACTAELASAGIRTALVGHAYRAVPGRPRFVAVSDSLDDVGDEALVAASALRDCGPLARVAVAPTRGAAMSLAAREGGVLVVDGVAQTRPVRASLALLSVDAADPWGGKMLRAPVQMLVHACDAIVPMLDVGADDPDRQRRAAVARFEPLGRDVWPAAVESRGAWLSGAGLVTWDALRGARLGLIVALARPDRLLRWLAARGVVPRVVVRGRNHGPVGASGKRLASGARGLDMWIATPKCALHAARAGLFSAMCAPLATLDHTVLLPPELRRGLRALASPRRVLTRTCAP